MNTIYRKYVYIIKETKKPKYLDFYDLNAAELTRPEPYINQTIRFDGKWYFIKRETRDYYTAAKREAAPKIILKNLYKPAVTLV